MAMKFPPRAGTLTKWRGWTGYGMFDSASEYILPKIYIWDNAFNISSMLVSKTVLV